MAVGARDRTAALEVVLARVHIRHQRGSGNRCAVLADAVTGTSDRGDVIGTGDGDGDGCGSAAMDTAKTVVGQGFGINREGFNHGLPACQMLCGGVIQHISPTA